MGNFVYSIRELETEVARLKIELKRADNYRVNQECEAISCKYRALKKIEQLNTEISELESERDALKAHTIDLRDRCKKVRLGAPCRAGRCPAWYDGCNYSPQTCEDLIERLEASEAIKTAQALKIGHLETLVMELERENRLPCAHVGRVRVLEGEVAQLKAHTWEQERVAVAAFIVGNSIHGWAWMKASIERGEHWPAEGEKA